ncbi:hypothetical protein HZS_6298 [Henneguya salminicola]|nr:hypothetical protein HZS_6298 [Henneguya salminicola]
MRYHGQTLIYDTFRSVAVPFTQCLIIMNEHIYCNVLPEMTVLMKYARGPRMITVDFEYFLISEVKFSIAIFITNIVIKKAHNIQIYHLAGRTNNCLERYNRRIGDFFINAHPNLAEFISVIKAEFYFYSEKYKETRKNARGIVYNRERFKKPPIPNDYIE